MRSIQDDSWSVISEFPNYLVSESGEIFNRRWDRFMRTYPNTHGHIRITLTDDLGRRHDRSVVKLVAEAFVGRPNAMCDHTTVLDGNLSNVHADNIIWRPRGFVWNYANQLKHDHPRHYHNLAISNVITGKRYKNVIECGMTEGLLFDDIWRSTYSNAKIFPHGHMYVVP